MLISIVTYYVILIISLRLSFIHKCVIYFITNACYKHILILNFLYSEIKSFFPEGDP